jgi:hypothetical protein
MCLRDAYGFVGKKGIVTKTTLRLGAFLATYRIPVEKFFKWLYACGLAYAARTPVDEIPHFPTLNLLARSKKIGPQAWEDILVLFPGKLRRFLRSFFRRCNQDMSKSASKKLRALSRGQTFLMFKKGSPEMSESMIQATKDTHKELLHENRGPGWEKFGNSSMEAAYRHSIKESVKLLVKSIFRKGSARVLYSNKQKLPTPSFRASYETSRSHGGASRLIGEKLSSRSRLDSLPFGRTLERMDYHPRVGVVETHKNPVKTSEFYDSVYKELRESHYDVTPVFLQEPLKIRTITKGPTIPYWYLKPIQKFLWRNVSRYPLFTLTGTPINAQYLNEQVWSKKESLPNSDEYFLVSADYSSATDNMKMWMSLLVWNEIAEHIGLGPLERRVGAKSLVGHTIHYGPEEVLKQWNGQLMGSPLSFPVLCIANAAVCTAAYWSPLEWGEPEVRVGPRGLPLAINGDDAGMAMTASQYATWKVYASFIGMEPSIGKCYTSDDWIEMNSELYFRRHGSFEKVPFLNLSLANPHTSRGHELRAISSFGPCCRSFVKDFKGARRQRALTLWIKRMFPTLRERVTPGTAWGLPEWLGGLGLPMLESEVAERTSKLSLQLASYLFQKVREGEVLRTLPGMSAALPKFLLRALRRAQRLLRSEPILEAPGEEWDEAAELRLFTPLIWDELQRTGDFRDSVYSNEGIGVAERAYRKRVRHLLFKARGTPLEPLRVLLTFKGVRTEPFGGVSDFFSKFDNAPRGLYTELSARFVKEQISVQKN